MKVRSERRDGQVILTVEVESERVEKAKEQAYRRLANRYVIPGFRKGKAPRAMVERYLGPAAILDEAMQQLVPAVCREVMSEQQLEPIAEPSVEVTGYEPVTIQAVVPLPPRVELGDYRSIRVTPEPATVTSEQVDEALERLREQHATWEPVDRPVELGDSVTLDLVGTRDGQPFTEETDVPYSVTAENNAPVPGFAEKLVGAVPHEPREIEIAFPTDYADERLAGKTYRFTATVREVKARVLPALDDAFARSLGEGLETVEQLRARIEQNLRTRAEAEAREKVEEQVLDQVVQASQLEFPPVLVDRRIHQEMDQRSRQLARLGVTLEQWLKYTNRTIEQLHDELEEPARRSLMRDLVLREVAKAEQIEATEDEIATMVRRVTRSSTPDEIQQMLTVAEVREVFVDAVLREKALRRLVEIATEGRLDYPPLAEQSAAESVDSTAAAALAPSAEAPSPAPTDDESTVPAAEAPRPTDE